MVNNLKPKLLGLAFLVFVLSGCYVNKYTDDSGNMVVEQEHCWGSGSGLSSRGPSRCNVYSKIYNSKGEFVEFRFEKKSFSGCTHRATFFRRVKQYDANGKLVSNKVEINTKNPIKGGRNKFKKVKIK